MTSWSILSRLYLNGMKKGGLKVGVLMHYKGAFVLSVESRGGNRHIYLFIHSATHSLIHQVLAINYRNNMLKLHFENYALGLLKFFDSVLLYLNWVIMYIRGRKCFGLRSRHIEGCCRRGGNSMSVRVRRTL